MSDFSPTRAPLPNFSTSRPPAVRWPLLIAGIVAAALFAWGYFQTGGHEIFFRAYLFSWLYFLGISLGGLCLVMLHNLTGGAWGNGPRVVGRAASLTLPLLALLFVPILFGLPDLYPWARPAIAATNDTLQHRHAYMNISFFITRTAFYFALWIFLAFTLGRLHRHWLATGDVRVLSRLRGLSAAGLILYLLTMTHAGIDWIMSRDIEFYSTAFGFILTVGQTLAALAFAIVIAALLPRAFRAAPARAAPGILNDIGNVLLTLVIFWTYVSFMQFLVIWMGNTREDNTWYIQRGLGEESPWRWIGLGLVLFHFFIPFYVLLFRAAKQYAPALAGVAWLLLASHAVEQYWLVAPTGREGPHFDLNWMDGAAFVAVGALWLACFLWIFERQAAAATVLAAPEPPAAGEGAPSHG